MQMRLVGLLWLRIEEFAPLVRNATSESSFEGCRDRGGFVLTVMEEPFFSG